MTRATLRATSGRKDDRRLRTRVLLFMERPNHTSPVRHKPESGHPSSAAADAVLVLDFRTRAPTNLGQHASAAIVALLVLDDARPLRPANAAELSLTWCGILEPRRKMDRLVGLLDAPGDERAGVAVLRFGSCP